MVGGAYGIALALSLVLVMFYKAIVLPNQSGFGYSCLACKTETTSTALAVMRYTII